MAEELERLTPRHRAVLALVAEGKSNKEIAIILGLSTHTVRGYLEDILLTLGVPNRAAAGAIWATDEALRGLDQPDRQPSSPSAE